MGIERYGQVWGDDKEAPHDASIELTAYRDNLTPEKGGLGKYLHLRNAVDLLFPEYDEHRRPIYVPSDFSDRRFHIWSNHGKGGKYENQWATIWGPGSCGKSTDFGMLSLMHWISKPDETTIIVCSTTRDMLEKRIFGEIVKYWKILDNQGLAPGQYIKTKSAIVLGDENSKNGIFGIAVLRGSLKEALGNMIGIHNRYVVLIIDEMHATKAAAVDQADNLSAGCEEFIFVGMGNPESALDPLGIYSEPKAPGGYKTIDCTHEEWETKAGRCYFFDGRKSPGITNPKRYPFMPGPDRLATLGRRRGTDSPQYWSQGIGFLPPEGLMRTVLTESFMILNRMTQRVEWVNDYKLVCGVDPAYSSGGDRCTCTFARFGTDAEGNRMIDFGGEEEKVEIPIVVSRELPLTYYLARKIKELCEHRGVKRDHVAIDCTSLQSGVADVLDQEWEAPDTNTVYRVYFGGRASEHPITGVDTIIGRDEYGNRVTELWYNMYHYGRMGMVRGISTDAGKQFCARKLLPQVKPVKVESKEDMKGTGFDSPDDADSKAVALAIIKERFGFVAMPQNRLESIERMNDNTDFQSKESGYDEDPVMSIGKQYGEPHAR